MDCCAPGSSGPTRSRMRMFESIGPACPSTSYKTVFYLAGRSHLPHCVRHALATCHPSYSCLRACARASANHVVDPMLHPFARVLHQSIKPYTEHTCTCAGHSMNTPAAASAASAAAAQAGMGNWVSNLPCRIASLLIGRRPLPSATPPMHHGMSWPTRRTTWIALHVMQRNPCGATLWSCCASRAASHGLRCALLTHCDWFAPRAPHGVCAAPARLLAAVHIFRRAGPPAPNCLNKLSAPKERGPAISEECPHHLRSRCCCGPLLRMSSCAC